MTQANKNNDIKSVEYFINEAIITLPGPIESDCTVNILKIDQHGSGLIVARGQLGKEETLEQAMDDQIAKLSKQVKELHFTAKLAVKIGANKDVDALEVQNKFVRGNERIFQFQVAFVLPGTNTMMALTYSRNTPLTESDTKNWHDIKQQIHFRPNK